jgi:hypothetical protein
MQPLVRDPITRDDDRGQIRKENKLVHFLVEEYKGGLNKLSRIPCDPEDYEQLMQLIGYSICGYTELSMISEESKEQSSRTRNRIQTQQQNQGEETMTKLEQEIADIQADCAKRILQALKRAVLGEDVHITVTPSRGSLSDTQINTKTKTLKQAKRVTKQAKKK